MTSRSKWALVPAFFVIALTATMLSAYSGASSSQGVSPEQPIPFPHPVHVKTLGMNCLYCHYSANKSFDPGLPAVGTCMGCHTIIGPNRPARDGQPARVSAGIKTLHEYAPVGQPDKWKEIPWVRIHKLPEYVRFPHVRHVSAGVTCQSCHGNVQDMAQVSQNASLNMGWCLTCHVNGYQLSEGLKAAGDSAGATAAAAVPPKRARYDCAVCHY
ncbi:MAG: cytochrome c3 family protein [Cytophagaceae bacterium]|nr:cytochrome c3 family protein [Gemmatimonadaceae bacterium]